MSRSGIVVALGAVLTLVVLGCWWLAPGWNDAPGPRDGDAAAAIPAATPATAPTPAPPPVAARASGIDGAFLAASLAAPDADLAPDDEADNRSGVLRGRLTVRTKPWLHPSAVPIRLTRAWLDSVVPTETEGADVAPRRDELRTTSDDEGRFAFRVVPPDADLFLLIGHRTEWEDYQKVAKLPRAGETVDLGDVWLDERGEIVGRVQHGGQAVAGATVRAVDDPLLDGSTGFEEVTAARLAEVERFRPDGTLRGGPVPEWVARRDRFLPFPIAVTDVHGGFRLRGVRPGNHAVFVTALDRGGHARSDGVLVAANQATEIGTLQLVVQEARHLRFVDERNQPWVGAQVALVHQSIGYGPATTRTDAQGRARLNAVAMGFGDLLFAYPGGGPWQIVPWPDPLERTRSELGFVVTRPAELTIHLVDEQGRALANGTVRTYAAGHAFRPVDRLLPPAMQPVERAPGEYVGQLPFPVTVVASVPGFAPAVGIARVPIASLMLLPLQSATVQVRTVHGAPVPDAEVRVQVHGRPDLTFPGAQWAALANDRVRLGRTDADGELTIPVWPTLFSFQVRHPDFAPTACPKQQVFGGERVELVLLGAAEIVGTLTFEGRPAPAGLRVRARQCPPPDHPTGTSGFLDQRVAVTGEHGSFALRRLAAGIWELQAEPPPRPTARGAERAPREWPARRVQLDEQQVLHTTLELQAEHVLPVQLEGVLTINGATVPGALVRARELPGEWPVPRARGRDRRRPVRGGDELTAPAPAPWLRSDTDAFGTFRFRELVAGAAYELRVDLPQGGRLQLASRRVVTAGTTQQATRADIALAATDVRLTCTFEGGPLARRMLRLRQSDGQNENARFELLLDADGQAWADALPAGKWTVEPMHGGRCEPAEFEVVAGTPMMLTIAVRSH